MTPPDDNLEDFQNHPAPDQARDPDAADSRDPFAAYWSTVKSNDQILWEDEVNPRRRGRAKNFGGDGVTDIRMSQTEVALRLGRHLAASPLLTSAVYLQLGGVELNRHSDDAVFPVARYLSRWGFAKDPSRPGAKPPWIGFYSHKRHSRKLLLNFDKFDGHVMAFFVTGQRLIVHCTAGNVTETRSPAEVHDLNRAMGRAIGWHGNKPDDVIAVCTPRSPRFRKLTSLRSRSVGVQRARLKFFHVDRGGALLGLDDVKVDP